MPEPDLWVDTEQGMIAAWRTGAGQPTLLLHGGPGISDYLEPLADELAPRCDVVRFQQRGFPPTTVRGPFAVEDHVGDALAVLDAVGFDRTLVVGHSWGAHLAMHLAVARPDRVAGLVVIDTIGVEGDGGLARMGAALQARMSSEVAARVEAIERRAQEGQASEADALEAIGLATPCYYADPSKAEPLPPWFRHDWEANIQTGVSAFAHVERGTLAEGLPRLRLPVLFVAAGAGVVPVDVQQHAASLVPGARFEVVPDCGHDVWVERPGVLGELIGGLVRGS